MVLFWEIIGWVAVVSTASQFFPQVVKAWRTKKVRDISLLSFILVTLTASSWLLYGYYKKDIVILAANALVFVSVIIIVVLKIMYRKK